MDLCATSTWTIVKFTEDNSVAAVPTKWINNDECVWPPYPPHNINMAIKNQASPDEHWPCYKIHIFRNATYDKYEKARIKAKLAEDTSDLGTTTETDEFSQKKRRKILKRKRIISSGSDDTDGDNAGITTPSHLPAPPSLYPVVTINPLNSQTDELSSDSEAPLSAKETLSQSATPSVTPTFKNEVFTPGKRRTTEVVTPGSSKDKQCTCCPKHAENMRDLLRNIFYLRSVANEILEAVTQNTTLPNKSSTLFVQFNFPLSTEEDLASFNLYLEQENQFNEAVSEIAKFGGKNSYEFAKRALSALITNNLASGYSWLGRRDKKPFFNTRMARLIIKSSENLNINQKEAEVAIQGWLKRAPERAKKD